MQPNDEQPTDEQQSNARPNDETPTNERPATDAQYSPPPPSQYPAAEYRPAQYPAAQYPPDPSAQYPAASNPAVTIKTARPWRVAIVAFLTLLVLIAALGNQWVTHRIDSRVKGMKFLDNAVRSITTYQWRFRPRGGHDYAHTWLGSLALVGSVLVLTLLLVAVVVRGRGGFGQTFIGTWLVVVVATVLADYVCAVVVNAHRFGLPAQSRANAVFFSALSPGAATLVAGLAFGFVVAVVAALTAVLSRRMEVIGGPPPVDEPATADEAGETPTYVPPEPAAFPADGPSHAYVPRANDTAQLPRSEWSEPSNDQTAQLPRSEWAEPSNDQTAQLPPTDPDDSPR